MRTVKLDDIVIGDHFRQDLGDINGLAASIRTVGLLQLVVVTPDNLYLLNAALSELRAEHARR